jgi:hypothetical protein
MPEPTSEPKGKWQRLAEQLHALAHREKTWDLTPVFDEKVLPLFQQFQDAANEAGLPFLVIVQTANTPIGGLFSASASLPGMHRQLGDPLLDVYHAAEKAGFFNDDEPGQHERSAEKCAACEKRIFCPIRADRGS